MNQEKISRRKPVFKNRMTTEIEQAVVGLAIEQPAWGQVRVANELRQRGLSLSHRSAPPSRLSFIRR